MKKDEGNGALTELLGRLRQLALNGPISAITQGTTAVGMTLLDALGIEHTSSAKPNFGGIVVTASRRNPAGQTNRVNLFAQVPDWKLSACKSSREIVARYGYPTEQGTRRLYCTVTGKRANSQSLLLRVSEGDSQLQEVFVTDQDFQSVATWEMKKLQERLLNAHPESLWVKATAYGPPEAEKFHYREAISTGTPLVANLPFLLAAGTVTLDHLIQDDGRRVSEKGPLFKIDPKNLHVIFPTPRKIDLLT